MTDLHKPLTIRTIETAIQGYQSGRYGWTQGYLITMPGGNPTYDWAAATACCIYGAICLGGFRAAAWTLPTRGDEHTAALWAIEDAAERLYRLAYPDPETRPYTDAPARQGLSVWNDDPERTKAEVLDLLRRASDA